jgi:bifunctional oligoribonuclease and PAP phosphatase NrnA
MRLVAMTSRRKGLPSGSVPAAAPLPTPVTTDDGLKAAAAALVHADSVAVICHENPDADTLGGGLALAASLRAVGVRAEVLCGSGWPSTLAFLPGVDQVMRTPSDSHEVVALVDCASVERAGPALASTARTARELVVIDHHSSNAGYGTINCIDVDAAASSEIVARVISELQIPPSRDVAVLLLAGILHDTDGLRSPETSAATLRLVADLVEHGASIGDVSRALFGRRPAAAVRLWGHVVRDLELTNDGSVVIGVVRREMLTATGAALLDAEDLPDLLGGIDGADIALLLREVEDGTRVSIRTTGDVAASEIAAQFGGGGHDRAAGCTLPMSVDAAREQLLRSLERARSTGRRRAAHPAIGETPA